MRNRARQRSWSLLALTLWLAGCGASPPPQPSRSSVQIPAPSDEASDALCDRRARAIELANEGDRAVKVDLDAAIADYEKAAELDPDNHRLFWKLALAQEKKEDWPRVEAAMSRAVQMAPAYATYWHKLGFAGVMQGAYEHAENPLRRCIENDKNFAECHALLGRVEEWAGSEQSALRSYTKAIELQPADAEPYLWLASLYFNLKLMPQAKAVLQEGANRVPSSPDNDVKIFRLYVMLAGVAEAERDAAASIAALEKGLAIAGDGHPEALFMLGRANALTSPPRKEEAVRLLIQFLKRACRGSQAMKFKEQCEEANSLLMKLGQ